MDYATITKMAGLMTKGGAAAMSIGKVAPVIGAVAGKLFGRGDQDKIDAINHVAGSVGQGMIGLGQGMASGGSAYSVYGNSMQLAMGTTDPAAQEKMIAAAHATLRGSMASTTATMKTAAQDAADRIASGSSGAAAGATGVAGHINAFPSGGSARDYFTWASKSAGMVPQVRKMWGL